MPSFAQAIVAGILGMVLSYGLGALQWYAKGAASVRAEWNADIIEQHKAIDAARSKAAKEQAALTVELQDQANAHTTELRARAADDERNRRDLARLRDALATAAIGHRERTDSPAAGPPPDGTAALAGELFGSCARELVDLGNEARGLAGQVIGLQDYARTAQKACGPAAHTDTE